MNLNDKNVLIIQLARSGDLLQTANAVAMAQKQHPTANFYLVARESFIKPVQDILLKTYKEIVTLSPMKEMIKEDTDLLDMRSYLRDIIKDIDSLELDYIFNFSFNKSSSYLSSLIKCPNKYGSYRNLNNQIVINDVWGQYIYSNVLGNTVNPFNLVDLFSFALGVTHFDSVAIPKKFGTSIIVHPFASNSKKRWNNQKWINTLHHITTDIPDTSVFIVGSKDDELEANQIANHELLKDRSIITFIDKNSKELIDLFKECRLFLGHDSLLSHIAAHTHTPSLILSLGSVRPNDTTPYNEFAYNLAPKIGCFPCKLESPCDDYACHEQINMNVVIDMAKQIFDQGLINDDFMDKYDQRTYGSQLNIYAHERSENGLVQYKLNYSLPDIKEIFLHFYTIIWQFYLRDISLNVPYSHMEAQDLDHLYQYKISLAKIQRLYQFASNYSSELCDELNKKNLDKDKLSVLMNKLEEIDQMLFAIVKSFPYLSPLVNFFYIKKNNTKGTTAQDMAIGSQLTFFEGTNIAGAFLELVEQTLIYNQYKTNNNGEVDI